MALFHGPLVVWNQLRDWLRLPSANESPDAPLRLPTAFPVGLKKLYTPPALDYSIDIIFIHDLPGDYEETWITRDSDNEPWPIKLLPAMVPGARILAFGYGTDVSCMADIVSHARIKRHAEELLNEVALYLGAREDKKNSIRPIIFVAHGSGGLICEQALVLARKQESEHLRITLSLTHGIILFNTPHFRAGLAEWAILCARSIGITSAKTAQAQDWSPFKNDLKSLAEMQRSFCNMVTDAKNINIACCFAISPVPGTELMLSPEWAILPRFRPIAIYADHFNMTKFKSSSDPGFQVIADLLSRWVEELKDTSVSINNPAIELALGKQHPDTPISIFNLENILKKEGRCDAKGSNDQTPLHLAAVRGEKAVARLFALRLGADKEARDKDGRTPLHLAAENGHEAVVKLLAAELSADKEARDNDRRTPLHLAAEKGREAVVELLAIELAANKEARDKDGRTPLYLANGNSPEAITKVLRAAKSTKADSKDVMSWAPPMHNGRTPYIAEQGHYAVC